MCTVHDRRPTVCHGPRASEMRRRFPAGPRLDAGAGGRSPNHLAWSVDRPSKRRARGPDAGEVIFGSLVRSVVGLSKRRASPEATEQGGLAPATGYQVAGQSGSAERPAPPILHPSGEIRGEAEGVGRGQTPRADRSFGPLTLEARGLTPSRPGDAPGLGALDTPVLKPAARHGRRLAAERIQFVSANVRSGRE